MILPDRIIAVTAYYLQEGKVVVLLRRLRAKGDVDNCLVGSANACRAVA